MSINISSDENTNKAQDFEWEIDLYVIFFYTKTHTDG